MKDSEFSFAQPRLQVTRAEVEEWIIRYVSELRGIRADRISRTIPLTKYGVDSASAVAMSGDLMDWLGCDIDPTLMYEHPTIERAAIRIALLANGADHE
ncbi:acyl carrier protein [Ramlibacter sp.]|uniref:acyl carrier protein n=1 Tax=Ramlibacter sp. TaxID=1917967 RepID=UPI003D10103C